MRFPGLNLEIGGDGKFWFVDPMKTLLKGLVAALLLSVGWCVPASAQIRLATVSMQHVFTNYWKTKQCDALLLDQATGIDKSNKEMVDDWKKGKEEWQKLVESANDQAVSSAEREKRKKAAEDKLAELKRAEDNITLTYRQASARLYEQKTQMRKKILEDIKSVVTSKAQAAGYTLVIDSDAQTLVPDPAGPYGMPTLLYTSGENDLTDQVLTQLNSTKPIDTSGTGEPRGQLKDDKKSAPDAMKAGAKDNKN